MVFLANNVKNSHLRSASCVDATSTFHFSFLSLFVVVNVVLDGVTEAKIFWPRYAHNVINSVEIVGRSVLIQTGAAIISSQFEPHAPRSG